MKLKDLILVTILIAALLAAAGCTGTSGSSSSSSPTAGASPGSPAAGSSAAGTSSAVKLSTVPTDVIPDYNAVTVDVSEKDYLGNIPVTFQGGTGQIHVTKIDIRLTRADGSTQTATLGNRKGDRIELQGTRGTGSLEGWTDRVEVWVTMDNGQVYKVADVLREYRSRA